MGQKKLAARCGLKSGWEMEMSENDSMGVRQVTSASLPLTCGESDLSCWRCSGAEGLSMISWRSWKASRGSVYSCSSAPTKYADLDRSQIRFYCRPLRCNLIELNIYKPWLTCLVVVLHRVQVIIIELSITKHILGLALAAFCFLIFWNVCERITYFGQVLDIIERTNRLLRQF